MTRDSESPGEMADAIAESTLLDMESFLAQWLDANGIGPMDAVLCQSTGWGVDGEVITRTWFERRH